jgi:hypothetical protein
VHSLGHAGIHASPTHAVFKDHALFFSMGEESSQAAKHANKIIKIYILDYEGHSA